MPTLLVIDDDRLILDCFRFLFPQSEVELRTAESAREGLAGYQEHKPDVVLLDVQLPDMSGLQLYKELRQIDSRTPIIFMTGAGTSETAIEAMRLGAYDYVTKPVDPDRIADVIRRAFHISRLMRVPAVIAPSGEASEGSEMLIGQCAAMQEVYKAIGRVAPQDVGVLILGESGTGKEMVARAIYHYSKRGKAPFLAINCAAIPEQLLESELFGHEKGAFTGAERRRIGKFEQCTGGTLFLDEIGDMTPLTQTKILRVLQDQRFERIGGNETIATDVRIIAATNRNLAQLMNEGQFRSDLYYRLNIYTIHLPPLRDRREDLPILTKAFVKRYARELNKDVQTIAPEVLEMIGNYHWPGNIRELQSVIKQAIVQASGPVLVPEFLPTLFGTKPAACPGAVSSSGDLADVRRLITARMEDDTTHLYAEVMGPVERLVITEALRHASSQVQAARILGITRQTLRVKLLALGLEPPKSALQGDES